MRSCRRTQHQPFYSHLAFEANWKGEKAQSVGASWVDCKSKKLSFWSVILFYTTTVHHFLIGLWHEITLWLRRSSKALSQTCTRKRSWSLVLCCQSDPLQLSESQQNLYIWEICSADWWDVLKTAVPGTGTGQQKRPSSLRKHPIARCTTSASKVEWVGLWRFASSIILIWPLTNRLPLKVSWQPFASTTSRMFSRVCWIPKHAFLCYRNKQT